MTTATGPAIAVHGIGKRYGSVVALDDVTATVDAGQVYAVVGLNGAGKSTLIRTLLGMVRPDRGRTEVLGRPVTDRRVWSQVGYLVETPAAYPELTVRQNLEVVRRLRAIADGATVPRVIDLLGLGAYADRRARTLSLGNTQRLGLAKALIHRPRLLILDEPVNGLDPAGVVEIRTLLVDLARDHGVTVVLSSHLLSEVARTATRIGVLHRGRLVDEFAVEDLDRRTRSRLEVRTRDVGRADQVLRQAGLHPRQEADGLVVDDPWAVRHPDLVATALVRGQTPPTRLAVIDEDLEHFFLRLVAAKREVERAQRPAEVAHGR